MRSNFGVRQTGVTLFELLAVIVIIGLLAAIAVPSYREYVMRTNRVVAKTALQELMARQEGYNVDHKSYAGTFGLLGIAGSAAATVAYVTRDGVISRNPANALYSFGISVPGTGAMSSTCSGFTAASTSADVRNGFRLSAIRVDAGTDTRCGTLCVSSTGERGAENSATTTDCWTR